MRITKKNLFVSSYANFPSVSPGQTALGARSLVFSPSARTCSLKRSHHYALGREHAGMMKSRRLKAAAPAKILRDRHAPW